MSRRIYYKGPSSFRNMLDKEVSDAADKTTETLATLNDEQLIKMVFPMLAVTK